VHIEVVVEPAFGVYLEHGWVPCSEEGRSGEEFKGGGTGEAGWGNVGFVLVKALSDPGW
jgi:hypothetical protein